MLRRIDTSPVGFALFDPVLLTVHPADCAVRDALHSLQGNRTNGIMRTLTTLTAVFLPLNLIAAIFGMNFEFIPLIHRQGGFWRAMGAMAAIALALLFWRKRYLARTGHR